MNGFWQTLRRKRAVLLSLCGVLALCVLAASTARRGGAVPASAEVTNWGLSFQQEGEPQPTRVYRHQAAPTGKQE